MCKNKKIKVSVVIPCFNEFKEILPNYKKAQDLVRRYPLEIIFLNNGSTDLSSEIFETLSREATDNIIFLSIKKNKGYGYGIKTALKHSNGEFIGWTHGDGQTDLMDLEKVFESIAKTPSVGMIKGSRVGRKFTDKFTSKILEIFCSALFGFRFRFQEINAQPSIYKAMYIRNYHKFSDDLLFDIDAYVNASIMNIQSTRFNVYFPPRIYGASSWNNGLVGKIKFIIKNVSHIISLRLKIKALS